MKRVRLKGSIVVVLSVIFCSQEFVTGNSFPQHVVSPAKRNVEYAKYPSERKLLLQTSRSIFLENHGDSGLVWCTESGYSSERDYGVNEFPSLRHQVSMKSDVTLHSADLSTAGASTASYLNDNFVSKWIRSFRDLTTNQLNNIQQGFFVGSENISSSESVVVQTSDQNAAIRESVSNGYNVTAATEYNVSAFIVHNASTSANGTGAANDVNTVIFTKVEPSNITSQSSNNNDYTGNNTTLFENHGSSNITQIANQSNSDEFQPIRIRAFLPEVCGGGQHLTKQERYKLLENIVRPALLSWSAALRVKPVKGNLTVDSSQLIDGQCGPDSSEIPRIPVPIQHLIGGVKDTDLIIYISLAFRENVTDLPIEYLGDINRTDFDNTSATQEYAGLGKLKNAFLDALVSESDQNQANSSSATKNNWRPKVNCNGDYLAASVFCSTDQNDRPTAALLHICIDETFFDPLNLPGNVRVIMHELGHSLGFNPVSMAHFRRPDGSPITERNSNGEIPLSEVNCTGRFAEEKSYVALPSPEILRFRTVRNGIRVAEIVTPSVVQVVRNHFDCQELLGAELESEPYVTNGSCIGDHWDRRLFQNDLMNPLVDMVSPEFNSRFSTLTLALFADSGWYQVDLARANYPSTWGRGAGCDFVEKPCITRGRVSPNYDQYFCTNKPNNTDTDYSSDIQGCTEDLSRKASCSISRYSGDLPQQFQYFRSNYGADFGGDDPFMDYCPVYSGFANGLCSDSENEALIKVNVVEKFGRRNSRCLSSHIRNVDYNKTNTKWNATKQTGATGLCMPIACVVEDHTLMIQVDGTWRTCKFKGDILETLVGSDIVSVTCPDPIRICPTFYCQRDCIGRSDGRTVCDYAAGDCVCDFEKYILNNETGQCVSKDLLVDNFVTNNETEVSVIPASASAFFINPNSFTGQLPDPESPLADYYVPTARNLQEDSPSLFKEVKFWLIGGIVTFLVILLTSIYLLWRRKQQQNVLESSQDTGDDQEGVSDINPDKHKMMASVVVNLRMNDPTLHRRVQNNILQNRDYETDLSLTDTEASYISSNDQTTTMGLRESSHESHDRESVAGDEEELNMYGMDPLADPDHLQQPVVRRRHVQMSDR